MEETFMIKIFLATLKKYEELRQLMTGRGEDYISRGLY